MNMDPIYISEHFIDDEHTVALQYYTQDIDDVTPFRALNIGHRIDYTLPGETTTRLWHLKECTIKAIDNYYCVDVVLLEWP
ncbi:hypothetical protein DLJ53_27580 [Acuticoccus sediminis]|uniref:Uncharacterized protein n=1 Tax=Acuticoccus sediminis TaxID=2184697 RepID=A0A8B2NFD0_9HYPH|nr:hypothetical protein [Acuticoccus sediminis]RAH97619.1 hypothetical protein DLJ53_27580 [Acuticoccus sediminis]